MNALNILTVIRHPVGGIRTYIKYTYGRLDRKSYRFTLVAPACREVRVLRDDLKGFNLDLVEVKGKRLGWALYQAVRRELSTGRHSLVHSHGFTAGLITAAANTPRRAPHVITSHDVFRPDQFKGATGLLKRRIIAAGLNRADMIQSVGHDAQANLLEYLPWFASRAEKLTVIQNGIPTDTVQATSGADPSLKRELGVPEDKFLFGFLGRFVPQKGFEHLINAVEELDRSKEYKDRFRVVAVNDGSFIREYKDEIVRRGLQRYFVFYGFAPNVFRILRELDALVMPSLWEAFSLVAMEAFVSGCPLIASDCTGLREISVGTPAIPIKAGDSHSAAEAMRDIMDNYDSYKIRALSYSAEARKKYDVRHTARALDGLLQRLGTPDLSRMVSS